MSGSWLTRGVVRATPLTLLLLLASLLAPAAAQADGGLAMSGSFSQQNFEIPQGSSVGGLSIDVVVFNNGGGELSVRMTSQAPVGVKITLSKNDFTIAPGGQQQVLIGVEVTKDAVPGQYEISVMAESYKGGGSGIQISGAARQVAKLVVLGESALVTVRAVSLDGQPLVAKVQLYKVVTGQRYDVALSEKGTLEAKVAPGSFISTCYVGGQKVAEESFTVAANEKKTVTLSAATVYFEGFDIVPNTEQSSGKLASVKIVYTVSNLYQRVAKGEVILEVRRNGAPLEQLSLANLSPLDIGRVGLNYNYIPAGGWVDGSYEFELQLKLDSKPYAASLVKQLKVGGSGSPPTGGMSPAVIGGIVAGVVVVAVVVLLLVRMRMRRRD